MERMYSLIHMRPIGSWRWTPSVVVFENFVIWYGEPPHLLALGAKYSERLSDLTCCVCCVCLSPLRIVGTRFLVATAA